MFEGCDGRVCDQALPSFVYCLSRLLNTQLCRGFVFIIKGSEVGGDGCFDDCGQASLLGCCCGRPAVTPSCVTTWMRGLAAMMGSQVRRSRDLSRSLVPDSSVACVKLSSKPGNRRSRERCPTSTKISAARFFCKDRVAMHSQDVVDAAASQSFPQKSKFCLRVLA